MKKLLILLLCGLFCSGTIFAQPGKPFDWEIREDVLYIHGEGAMPDYAAIYESGLAHSSDAPWFEWQNTFTKVEIDEGITSIGDNSFFLCSNLVSVSIPLSVTSIGDGAFAGCINLFSIDIPPWVTHIGIEAFYSCITLAYVIIPNSVTSIGYAAFSDCFNLNSVTISSSVASIGGCAFSNCGILSEIINLSPSPQDFDLINFLFSITILETCMLWVPAGSVDTYKNTEGWKLFDKIEPLVINITLTKEDIFLISGEKELMTYLVSGDITNPFVYSWTSDNPAVATVDQIGMITAISPGQAEITLAIGDIQKSCVVTVSNNGGTDGLLTWEINNSTLTISGDGPMPDYSFQINPAPWYEYRNSITSVEIGDGITSIGDFALYNCQYMTSISIGERVTSIGESAFEYCYRLSSVNIPASVTSIGNNAFYDCSSLTSVDIPESVLYIGDQAFAFCALTSVVIPASVTTIGNWVFDSCTRLTSVFIPATLTSIGSMIFTSCSRLSEIICMHPYPPTIYTGMFDETIFATCILHVPAGSVVSYEGAAVWGNFEHIEAIPEGNAGSLSWEIINGTLYISGEGDMPDYNRSISEQPPWTEHIALITSVEIGEGVTRIGNHSFASHNRLASVSISSTVASIGTTVFEYCGNLTSITIPSTVLSIGSPTFVGAGLISISVDAANPNYSSVDGVLFNKDVTTLVAYPSGKTGDYFIPSTVETIGEYSFSQSYNPSSVTIPASVMSIEHNAFWRNFGISSIFIPASVTSIGSSSLTQCRELISVSADINNPEYASEDGVLFNKDMTTLLVFPNGRQGHYNIPESVESIGVRAFEGCSLSSVTIPESVTNIDNFALSDLINMTSITIPSSVIRIGFSALAGCTGVTSFTIPTSVTIIESYAFAKCSGLKEVINPALTPQVMPANVFEEINLNACILRVPAASVNLYRDAVGWKEIKNIVALEAGLILEEEEIYLLRSSAMMMKAAIGNDVINPAILSWVSSDTDVATVNVNGTITAVSPGTAVITAFIGSMQAACTVTVIEEGESTIQGTVNYTGTETITVNLYIKLPDAEDESLMKGKVAGSYILLAKTTTNASGQYVFDNLPPGDYLIDVEIDDFESEFSPEITLSNNDVRSGVNFTVDSGTHTVISGDPTTGTKELPAAGLTIYPNPFAAHLYIEKAAGCTLRIFAIDGKQVHIQKVTGANEVIHLEHLPAGIYIIRMENGGNSSVVRVVKQ